MSTERESVIRFLKSHENENNMKVRIRNIPAYVAETSPKNAAMTYFNKVLKANVQESELRDCFYVDDWIKNDSKNVIVTFSSNEIRRRIYEKRDYANGGVFDVCDELDRERLDIWKKLSEKTEYTPGFVITHDGGVLLLNDGEAYFFVSYTELESFTLSKTELILNNYFKSIYYPDIEEDVPLILDNQHYPINNLYE